MWTRWWCLNPVLAVTYKDSEFILYLDGLVALCASAQIGTPFGHRESFSGIFRQLRRFYCHEVGYQYQVWQFSALSALHALPEYRWFPINRLVLHAAIHISSLQRKSLSRHVINDFSKCRLHTKGSLVRRCYIISPYSNPIGYQYHEMQKILRP
jgi:hypothetical protein